MAEAFICDAVRTPIGRYAGALAAVRPDDLAAHVIRTLIGRNPNLDGAAIGVDEAPRPDHVATGSARSAIRWIRRNGGIAVYAQ